MAYVLLFDGPRAGEVVNVGFLREYYVVVPHRLDFSSLEDIPEILDRRYRTVTYRPAFVNTDGSRSGIWSIYGTDGAKRIIELLVPIVKQIRLEVQERLHDG